MARASTVVGVQSSLIGAEYTDEEREFLVAIELYQRKEKRRYPAWSEILLVFKSLGYRRPDGKSN